MRQVKQRLSGAALLLSLWALFLLSAMVISWAINIDSRMTQNGAAVRAMADYLRSTAAHR